MPRIPGYQILGALSRREHVSYYRALSSELGHAAVLKVLNSPDPGPSEITEIHNEYHILTSASIPGVLQAKGLLHANRTPVLVLEDFAGRPVTEIIGERDLNIGESLEAALQVSCTLESLHARGIIHGNINPQNLLATEDMRTVRLCDFAYATGISRELAVQGHGLLRRGTLAYLAPEQTGRMSRHVDERSDLYALGAVLYRLLTGRAPFEAVDAMRLIHSHIAEQPSPPHYVRKGIPRTLSKVAMKLLAKAPEDRYQTAVGLHYDLQRCLDQWRRSGCIGELELGTRDVANQFRRPQKLYGREEAVERVVSAVQRASDGACLFFGVTGSSGVGKSSLVNQIRPTVRQKGGYFVSGKYDQVQRDIPYRGFIQCIQSLIRQVLAEDDSRVNELRQQILEAVGRNGAVLTDVIPEIELIVGPQPSVQALPTDQARNRFNQQFLRLTRVFARPDHPLVVFLDDLQWADSPSLAMIELLVGDARIRHLLLIGAYRDREEPGITLLAQLLEALAEAGAPTESLALEPLSQESVSAMLDDSFHGNAAETFKLAQVVLDKTQGNPFFIDVFLRSLCERQLIRFDQDGGSWLWDLAQIQQSAVTENVADLMVGRIQELSAVAQQLLHVAACIGNRFELQTLALVSEHSPEAVADELWPALAEHFIQPLGEGHELDDLGVGSATLDASVDAAAASYRFTHDRIQGAAYDLVPETSRTATHYRIGRLMLDRLAAGEVGEDLLAIANHLNRGWRHIRGTEETEQVAKLNLRAGRKAKAAAAFVPALRYFSMGARLLPESYWETHPELAAQLLRERAECEYLTGELEQSEQSFAELLARDLPVLDKAGIYEVRLMLYTAMAKYREAVDQGLAGLAILGVKLKRSPTTFRLLRAHLGIRRRLLRCRARELAMLPETDDPERTQVTRLLVMLAPPTYLSGQAKLMALSNLKAVDLSLRQGNADHSPVAYAGYGLLLASVLGEINLGYDFGRLAEQLCDRCEVPWVRSKTLFSVATGIVPWKRHLQEAIPLARRAYRDSLDSGDNLMGCYLGIRIPVLRFLKGDPLEDVAREASGFLDFIRYTRDKVLTDNALLWLHIYHCLGGKTEGPLSWNARDFDAEKVLRDMKQSGYRSGLAVYYIYKAQLHLLFRDFPGAMQMAQAAKPYLASMLGQPDTAEVVFYRSLAMASHLTDTGSAKRPRLVLALRLGLSKLRSWARQCPPNFAAKYALVRAEYAVARGREQAAMRLFASALGRAQEHGLTHIEAMSAEWAAHFFRRQGYVDVAVSLLERSRNAYLRWGAGPKADLLTKDLGDWSPESRRSRGLAVDVGKSNDADQLDLDLGTVIKAAESVSAEIDIERLLERLLELVLTNAGAQRGLLLLVAEGRLLVQAERQAASKECRVLQATALEEHSAVARTVVKYVARSQQRVVLRDAGKDSSFAADPYIVKHAPKSILCLPIIRQVKLIGVLYLENNLVEGAFTTERVGLLSLLSSQMAISIENADLYRELQIAARDLTEANKDLEYKVARRTDELNRKNLALNQALGRVERANRMVLDSLQYAKLIQQALLPTREKVKSLFNDSFLLWLPRDIVGGDLYFLEILPKGRLVVVADCTGHGVPGALMTVIAISALRQIVSVDGCFEPAEILFRLNLRVKSALGQDSAYAPSDDGLDAGICRIGPAAGDITFSGAGLPLRYIEDNQLHFIRGDRQSIGYKRSDPSYRFTSHRRSVREDTCLYLATDGFADQLGESNGFPMGNTAFHRALQRHHESPCAAQEKRLLAELDRHRGELAPQDDITVLGLRLSREV